MNFERDENQKMIAQMVRDFAEKEIRPHMNKWDEEEFFPVNVMKKMAIIVDQQNVGDKKYESMSENFDKSIAFSAACDLVFKGREQPSGYTEPLLHQKRLEKKYSK